jgi:hypothetical protein
VPLRYTCALHLRFIIFLPFGLSIPYLNRPSTPPLPQTLLQSPPPPPSRYFQAIKRLVSNLQRIYPTDPSRSVDFNLTAGEGRGATGGGSQKAALLEAQQRGEVLALAAAPHHMAPDGSVAIPRKWDNVLNEQMQKAGVTSGGGGGGGGGGPPRTPPRSGTPGSRPYTPPAVAK